MKFLIVESKGDGKFPDLAQVDDLATAVEIVHALARAGRSLQLWGTHKRRSAWFIQTHVGGRPLSLSECLANATASEKKWKAGEKAKRQREAFTRDNHALYMAAGFLTQPVERRKEVYQAIDQDRFSDALALLEAMKAERSAQA